MRGSAVARELDFDPLGLEKGLLSSAEAPHRSNLTETLIACDAVATAVSWGIVLELRTGSRSPSAEVGVIVAVTALTLVLASQQLDYLENWLLLLDVVILVATVKGLVGQTFYGLRGKWREVATLRGAEFRDLAASPIAVPAP